MEKRTVIIGHRNGLHLRVAADIVKLCRKFDSRVSITCEHCPEANACSILSLLQLAARQGDELTVTAEGKDAQDAAEVLTGYLSRGGTLP